ncbi:hypothetical protein SMD22_01385 (plasmid) [Brevibacillus halotolerans]|nr:hypothetical protein SMD22_01385 [Brevibacillus halotolerans]
MKISETKELYVSRKKKLYKECCRHEGKVINIGILKSLVAQWKFDYEVDRQFGRMNSSE